MDGIPVTPAATPAPQILSPQEMSPEQTHQWKLTGKTFPKEASSETDTPSPSAAPAESAPASPERAASTDALSAGSDPAPPAKTKGRGVKERNAELDAEIQSLNEKLRIRNEIREQLKATEKPAPDAPTDSSPKAPTKAEYQRFREMPDAPTPDSFDTFEDFTAAMATFISGKQFEERFEQAFTERTSQQERTWAEAREFETKARSYQERMASFEAEHAGDFQSIHPTLLKLQPISLLPPNVQPTVANFLAQQIFDSEHPGPIAAYFSTPDGQAHWRRMTSMPPEHIVREFGRLEARWDSGAASAAPPKKTISSAPEPPTTLGRKAAAAVDPLEAARKAGNTKEWIRLRNQEALGKR